MDFKSIKSLDELMIRTSQVEVLLSSIKYENGFFITPSNCPAIGRKEDSLKVNDEPFCFYGNKKCPYLQSATFELEDYTKRILCTAINIEDVKKTKG